jgi:hypothetical protein
LSDFWVSVSEISLTFGCLKGVYLGVHPLLRSHGLLLQLCRTHTHRHIPERERERERERTQNTDTHTRERERHTQTTHDIDTDIDTRHTHRHRHRHRESARTHTHEAHTHTHTHTHTHGKAGWSSAELSVTIPPSPSLPHLPFPQLTLNAHPSMPTPPRAPSAAPMNHSTFITAICCRPMALALP